MIPTQHRAAQPGSELEVSQLVVDPSPNQCLQFPTSNTADAEAFSVLSPTIKLGYTDQVSS